jgi:hypothetical protein
VKHARRLLLCAAVSCCLMAGCYRYTPVTTPEAGMEVRAQLTSEAAVRRSQGLDEPVLRYHGIVVDAGSDSLAMDVIVARASSGLQDLVIRDTVSLQRSEIQSVMRREISAARSVLFALAAGAAAAAVVASVDHVVGGVEEPPDDIPPAMRPSLISWQTLRLLIRRE